MVDFIALTIKENLFEKECFFHSQHLSYSREYVECHIPLHPVGHCGSQSQNMGKPNVSMQSELSAQMDAHTKHNLDQRSASHSASWLPELQQNAI